MGKLYCTCALFASCSLACSQPFTDVGPWLDLFFMIQSSDEYSSGASFVDFDLDGKDDLTFANGLNTYPLLYRNTGDGFVAVAHNVAIYHDKKMVIWVDYDQDGDLDLYVAGRGRWLYRRDGLYTFTDVSASIGLPGTSDRLSYGSAWADLNKDGFPDLVTTDRLGNTPDGKIHVLMNQAGQSFSSFGFDNFGSLSFPQVMAVATTDANNDGWEDILLGQVYGHGTYLLKNNNGHNFTSYFIEDVTEPHSNTMTMTVADADGDGWEDFYLTDTNLNSLMRNNGDLTYTDVTSAYGLDSLAPGWGAQFLDFNGDLSLDLHVNTFDISVHYEKDTSGAFVATEAGFESFPFGSIALCVGDINNDRVPDILKTNSYPRSPLWQNETAANRWISVSLVGTSSNKNGIGAVIHLFSNNKQMTRRIHAGENMLSQNSYTSYFGTGEATHVDSIKVYWPSGEQTVIFGVQSDQHITIIEGPVGCMDPEACNFSSEAVQSGIPCAYPAEGMNCDGACLEDTDQDGLCDFLETPGCMEPNACNFNPLATLNIASSCYYPMEFLDCSGNCLSDADLDGICDPLELSGCTDDAACNYNPTATDDDGNCTYLVPNTIHAVEPGAGMQVNAMYTFYYATTPGNYVHWSISDSAVISAGQGTDSLDVIFLVSGIHSISVVETAPTGCSAAAEDLLVNVAEDHDTPVLEISDRVCFYNGNIHSSVDGTIQIFDFSGRLLFEKDHLPPISRLSSEVIAQGLYLVVFRGADKVISKVWRVD